VQEFICVLPSARKGQVQEKREMRLAEAENEIIRFGSDPSRQKARNQRAGERHHGSKHNTHRTEKENQQSCISGAQS
jgi:hypothetical protein